jgi:hypothetical protein
MCRQFEQETTSICLGHVESMLKEFAADPNANWKAKDAAVRRRARPQFSSLFTPTHT